MQRLNEKDPRAVACFLQGDEGDAQELHVIPKGWCVSLEVWDVQRGRYEPEAGLHIEAANVDALIAGLQAAKAAG